MSKNPLYKNEIATANNFIMEHQDDLDFITFLQTLNDRNLIHSDRWSLAYDYLNDHFPDKTNLATGIAYLAEN